MALLFTSLFGAGDLGVPDAPPAPAFTWTDGLAFRFSASDGVFGADGVTPAADGDPVARWQNLGTGADAVQGDAARRPVHRTGGINGRPCIACSHDLQQCFEDLAFTQPSGSTTLTPFTVFAVTDAIAATDQFPALLGAPYTNGGKVALYFRPVADAQIHFIKSGIRTGNLTSPQLLMAAAGRNAAGATSNPYTRLWLRQNRADIYAGTDEFASLSAAAIAGTEFLRSSGIFTGGYFDGHLYEFLLYDRTLDDATTFAVEDWLAARYGLA